MFMAMASPWILTDQAPLTTPLQFYFFCQEPIVQITSGLTEARKQVRCWRVADLGATVLIFIGMLGSEMSSNACLLGVIQDAQQFDSFSPV